MFGNWQSSHSLIGSFEDLNAASVADVSKFFKTYYAPEQRRACDSGRYPDSRSEEAGGNLLRRHPGAAAAEAARYDRAGVSAAHAKHTTTRMARVPAVMIGWPGPKRRSPDYYALNMLDAILTNGNSARFRHRSGEGQGIDHQYESNLGWPM